MLPTVMNGNKSNSPRSERPEFSYAHERVASIEANKAHHRNRSASEVKPREASCKSPIRSDGVTSNKSRRSIKSINSKKSGMTRNPMHFQEKVMQHIVPGIDDRESHLYRGFDHKGRIDQSFY